jgi:hypothetical protein
LFMLIVRVVTVSVALCVAGCAAAPKMAWVRTDGQRARDNSSLATQFEIDSIACVGERNKAALSGVTFTGGGLAGMAAGIERSNAADTVARGCMAERGYLSVPEDQVEAKSVELAALAEQKRRQEAAAQAPTAAPRRR